MNIEQLKVKIWRFLFTQMIVPFDVAFASYCIYGGVSGLLKWGAASDSFATALGTFIANIFNGLYVVAGLALFFGIGAQRRNIQSFGLYCIISALIVRIIVISAYAGLDERIIGLYFINLIFITACVVRLYMLSKYSYILKLIKDDVNNGAKQ